MHIAHTTASSYGGLKKTSWLVGLILLLVGLSPQTFAATNDSDVIEEVIVTGSYIKGSPEDAELPIDVISSEDLLKTGSPSIVDMIRNLGVTTANLGETNQFTSGGQANEGVATVNLRGLGSSRTLVLINGRRLVHRVRRVPPQWSSSNCRLRYPKCR